MKTHLVMLACAASVMFAGAASAQNKPTFTLEAKGPLVEVDGETATLEDLEFIIKAKLKSSYDPPRTERDWWTTHRQELFDDLQEVATHRAVAKERGLTVTTGAARWVFINDYSASLEKLSKKARAKYDATNQARAFLLLADASVHGGIVDAVKFALSSRGQMDGELRKRWSELLPTLLDPGADVAALRKTYEAPGSAVDVSRLASPTSSLSYMERDIRRMTGLTVSHDVIDAPTGDAVSYGNGFEVVRVLKREGAHRVSPLLGGYNRGVKDPLMLERLVRETTYNYTNLVVRDATGAVVSWSPDPTPSVPEFASKGSVGTIGDRVLSAEDFALEVAIHRAMFGHLRLSAPVFWHSKEFILDSLVARVQMELAAKRLKVKPKKSRLKAIRRSYRDALGGRAEALGFTSEVLDALARQDALTEVVVNKLNKRKLTKQELEAYYHIYAERFTGLGEAQIHVVQARSEDAYVIERAMAKPNANFNALRKNPAAYYPEGLKPTDIGRHRLDLKKRTLGPIPIDVDDNVLAQIARATDPIVFVTPSSTQGMSYVVHVGPQTDRKPLPQSLAIGGKEGLYNVSNNVGPDGYVPMLRVRLLLHDMPTRIDPDAVVMK